MAEQACDSHGNFELVSASRVKFVRWRNFLAAHDRETLFSGLCEHQNLFHPPGGPSSEWAGTLSLSLADEGVPWREEIDVSPVREAAAPLVKGIQEALPALFDSLEVEPFAVSEVPLSFNNGFDGHSGPPHADTYGDRFRISVLYYFHQSPKQFRGGDLQFHDSDTNHPSAYSEMPVATVEQEDNLLIAFRSETFHSIIPVECSSTEFADGRFVAIAFLGESIERSKDG